MLPLLAEKHFVHGDILMSNFMFRMSDSDNRPDASADIPPAVQIIDVDFAGVDGVVRYPWNVNTPGRPRGARSCAPIQSDHDQAALNLLTDTGDGPGNGAGLNRR